MNNCLHHGEATHNTWFATPSRSYFTSLLRELQCCGGQEHRYLWKIKRSSSRASISGQHWVPRLQSTTPVWLFGLDSEKLFSWLSIILRKRCKKRSPLPGVLCMGNYLRHQSRVKVYLVCGLSSWVRCMLNWPNQRESWNILNTRIYSGSGDSLIDV